MKRDLIERGAPAGDGAGWAENHSVEACGRGLVMRSAQPVLTFLLGLRGRFIFGEEVEPEAVRAEFKRLLHGMEDELLQSPGHHDRVEVIRYVVTALADEVIIFSPWGHAGKWRENPLEMDIFGETVAGERFFQLLEKEGYRDPELAELFYACLCLGFDRAIVKERDYKRRLYSLIEGRLPEADRRLSPGAEETIAGENTTLPPLFGFMAVTVVLVVSALIYTVSSQLLWKDATEFLHKVSEMLRKGF